MTDARKTLLLVEDHPIVAALEKRQLTQLGYTVKHVSTGEDAVAEVERDPAGIDMILMDIDLGPLMDGIEAGQTIVESHDIPIIFLSSHYEKEVVERTEQISSYGYVLKSSGVFVLAAQIKTAFKLHEELAGRRNVENTLPHTF